MNRWLIGLAAGWQLGLLGVLGCNETPSSGGETKPAASASGASSEAPKAAASPTEPIKVGILHSLSGTMAISETSLRDVALMTIEEINGKGGVLGRKLEPVVVDPASNWPLFAEKARELLQKDKVATVFGC